MKHTNRLLEVAVVVAILGVLAMCLSVAVRMESSRIHTQARWKSVRNDLKQVGLALANYVDEHERMPYAEGHCWRVLLLPYLKQTPHCRQYDFSLPWNSPHNSKRGKPIPPSYGAWPTQEGVVTAIVRISGTGSAWDAIDECLKLGRKPSEELSSMIVLSTVNDVSIHWMEPRDLDTATMKWIVGSSDGPSISSDLAYGQNTLYVFASLGLHGRVVRLDRGENLRNRVLVPKAVTCDP